MDRKFVSIFWFFIFAIFSKYVGILESVGVFPSLKTIVNKKIASKSSLNFPNFFLKFSEFFLKVSEFPLQIAKKTCISFKNAVQLENSVWLFDVYLP